MDANTAKQRERQYTHKPYLEIRMLTTIAIQAKKSREAQMLLVQLDMIEVQVAAMQAMEKTPQIVALLERLITDYHAIQDQLRLPMCR